MAQIVAVSLSMLFLYSDFWRMVGNFPNYFEETCGFSIFLAIANGWQ